MSILPMPPSSTMRCYFSPPAYSKAYQYRLWAMAAHYFREATGEGQHVDVSIQACIPRCNVNATGYWELEQILIPGVTMKAGTPREDDTVLSSRSFWKCKDGYVVSTLSGGVLMPVTLCTEALVGK